ncbi:uncharacterized protein BP5553_03042 [Venustampulla echinocandica]|uniref:Thioesterase ester dehydrase-isomerase n=1 Tax=Venustampulla echinocandica TaxID=2656787 RepID=A0A370TT47_9HELO|nr:uncharacterized protein BP5553_03042 [Venustampulla echinocandica]RDL38702.1 hypothetical protein BP5553_03042 [Venustampulla echinocandica]
MGLSSETLSNLFSSPTAIIAGLIGLFCLLNLKSLPFFWHLRIISAFTQHRSTSFNHNPSDTLNLSKHLHTPLLFRPLITTTRCSILEIDYVLHKSNSTYLTDLDISRVHLLLALFKNGIANLQKNEYAAGKKKTVMPVLGGVSVSFRRAIPPLQKYDVVTRVLCWDEKWIYVVSWFVKAGYMGGTKKKKEKESYGSSNGGSANIAGKQENTESSRPIFPKNVYATSLAKYVIKAGSVTVKPESLIVAGGLLPVGGSNEAKGARAIIEKERLRALKYGTAFSQLDGLHGELDVDVDTLGFFRDLV